MKVSWGRSCAGALISEIAQIAAAFGWVAICCLWAVFQGGDLFAQSVCVHNPIQVQGVQGISGYVLDEKGLPIETAVVRLLKPDADSTEIRTSAVDDSGRFQLKGVEPGKYYLRAEYPLLTKLVVQITVLPLKPDETNAGDEIRIVLVGDLTYCNGNHVELVRSKPKPSAPEAPKPK
jgi:hypothetical protein